MSESALSIDKKVDLETTNKDVKKRILKITRENLDYLLQIDEDGMIVHETRMRDIDSLKQQFEGISQEVNLYWKDKNGAMNIRLNSKESQTEIIQFVNYALYSKDIVFKATLDAIKKQEEFPSKLVSEKKATEILLSRIRKLAIGAATLGIGCVLYAFHIDANVDLANEITRLESDLEQKNLESMNNEDKMVMNSVSNLDVSSEVIDIENTEKNNLLYLYNQPLLSTDLNIYMYQMSKKYHVPYQSLISIAHVESDGNFNNHGKTGCSGDQGVMQINPANYPVLLEKLGYTPDQIQNDDQVNIECAAFLLQDMYNRNVKRNGSINMEELYREYNGGVNFKNIPATEEYLGKIHQAIDLVYNDNNLICVEIPELGVSK